jgi:hypothetical protein
MKTPKSFAPLMSALVLVLGLSSSALAQTAQRSFVHAATTANTSAHITTLDHPGLNGDPNAVVTVTHNWNPPGASGVYLNCIFGAYYTGSKWALFNQNTACVMPVGARFNVSVGEGFVHNVSATNSSGHITHIDHPLANGNPSAILTASHLWKGSYNTSDIGLWYDTSRAKWAIFNENTAVAMTTGMAFSVHVQPASRYAFTYVVPAGTVGYTAAIDHVLLNGNPNAVVTLTKNWTAASTYNSSPASVYYDGSKWRVYFNDYTAIANMAFNVEVH